MSNVQNVLNLATGTELAYMNVIPSEAVILAHLQQVGKYNTATWQRDYIEHYPRLVWGEKTVGIGDFACHTGENP